MQHLCSYLLSPVQALVIQEALLAPILRHVMFHIGSIHIKQSQEITFLNLKFPFCNSCLYGKLATAWFCEHILELKHRYNC